MHLTSELNTQLLTDYEVMGILNQTVVKTTESADSQ